MKTIAAVAILSGFAGVVAGQETVRPDQLGSWLPQDMDACATLYGSGRDLCLANRYHMQQEGKVREQLVALQRAEEENQRLHTQLLQRELTRPSAPASVMDFAALPDFPSWQADNRWFGADRARTEYALLYARDLRQEQPALTGRAFLNVLSARVKEVFAPAKR
jgi:hypothetical protein